MKDLESLNGMRQQLSQKRNMRSFLSWRMGSEVFYLLMGIGRAVYESTNKAIFADFFPGEAPTAQSLGCFWTIDRTGHGPWCRLANWSVLFCLKIKGNCFKSLHRAAYLSTGTPPPVILHRNKPTQSVDRFSVDRFSVDRFSVDRWCR